MSHKIFDNGLVAIRKKKFSLTLNKPAHTGVWILELSKVLMYELYYDCIKIKYGYNLRLLSTDTESLLFD